MHTTIKAIFVLTTLMLYRMPSGCLAQDVALFTIPGGDRKVVLVSTRIPADATYAKSNGLPALDIMLAKELRKTRTGQNVEVKLIDVVICRLGVAVNNRPFQTAYPQAIATIKEVKATYPLHARIFVNGTILNVEDIDKAGKSAPEELSGKEAEEALRKLGLGMPTGSSEGGAAERNK